MPRFRAHVILQVRVTSEVCEAADAKTAFAAFCQNVDFERLLRNSTGSRNVNTVAFNGFYERAIIDALDQNDQFQNVALDASGTELLEILPRRTSSSSGN
jgi:hypothetical protein